MSNVPNPPVVLDLAGLAARWTLTVEELRRRMKKLNLPAVNVGTPKSPDYRFRVSAIEAWEVQNETTLSEPLSPGLPVLTGAPPGLDGYVPFKNRRNRNRPRLVS